MVRSVMLSGMQDAGFGTVCSRSQMAFQRIVLERELSPDVLMHLERGVADDRVDPPRAADKVATL